MIQSLLTEFAAVPASQMLLAFAASFVGIGFRGFQNKNITGNHYKLAFVTSYMICAADLVSFGLVATNGLIMIVPAGTGAALGIVIAMWVHDRFVRSKT